MLRSERGQSLVELALVLPLLILLLMGIADLGRAFYSYIEITNAAREGARYAVRHYGQSPLTLNPSIENVVSEAMNCGTLLAHCPAPLTHCRLDPPPTTQADWDGRRVLVTVRCDFTPMMFAGLFPLQNAAAMKVEGP